MIPKVSSPEPIKVLTIAGSDSGGAAGLQADLKTFTTLGVYGMNVVTVITAQNSVGITAIQAMSPEFVAAQLDSVLSDYGAAAAKTGFIGRTDLITIIADRLRQYPIPHVVIDPVLVDYRQRSMFPKEVADAYCRDLIPLADLITPNLAEAALLIRSPSPASVDLAWCESAARQLFQMGPRHVLLKAGQLANNSVDIFFDGRQMRQLRRPWINTPNTHGSGDTLSAAVSAFLAQGMAISKAVEQAHQFTGQAIERAAAWRLGQGHGPVANLPSAPTSSASI